ncbi:MAG: ribosomal protein S18-alanine N-acetyltransferase [Gemmatimonadaceae bacterium]|nr:ribosomal protein S18-alanine N-acetyltransferase [Gemmatimonadaceae bacterium]
MHDARARESVVLRAASPADVGAMAAIELAAFSDPWPASAFRELMDRDHARVIVAVRNDAVRDDVVRDDAVRGYCILLHVLDEGEIGNIAVTPAARGAGVASTLLDDALAFATDHGLQSVFLEVRVSNAAARGLYDSRGFQVVGRRRAYYQQPIEDALVLRWERPT